MSLLPAFLVLHEQLSQESKAVPFITVLHDSVCCGSPWEPLVLRWRGAHAPGHPSGWHRVPGCSHPACACGAGQCPGSRLSGELTSIHVSPEPSLKHANPTACGVSLGQRVPAVASPQDLGKWERCPRAVPAAVGAGHSGVLRDSRRAEGCGGGSTSRLLFLGRTWLGGGRDTGDTGARGDWEQGEPVWARSCGAGGEEERGRRNGGRRWGSGMGIGDKDQERETHAPLERPRRGARRGGAGRGAHARGGREAARAAHEALPARRFP